MNSVSFQPYVVEDENSTTLYFDSNHVQSAMSKDAPHELRLGYTHVMMSFLLLNPQPLDILIVGLGGGSLSKYCHHLLPNARITTVEISRDVIGLRDIFCIPQDNDFFKIVHANAVDYLKNKSQIADVILLDGYDEIGLPKELRTTGFYANCHKALRKGGVLVANIRGDKVRIETCNRRMKQVFKGEVLWANAILSGNQIAFALKQVSHQPLEVFKQRAHNLRQQTALPFPRFLDLMWDSAHSANNGENWLEALPKSPEIDPPKDMPTGCSTINI